jgi:hypothetical protein
MRILNPFLTFLNRFFKSPLGFYLTMTVTLQTAYLVYEWDLLSCYIVWILSMGIAGWRIMETVDQIRWDKNKWIQNQKQWNRLFVFFLLLIFFGYLMNLELLMFNASALAGIAMVFIFRNDVYRMRYGHLTDFEKNCASTNE